ncbi:D-2-hydroxyacid dehydrogenase [Actinomadura sp. 3N508]|uniref:D-2-hydroxyacid dehydrogenase n=1 Tax=Actinomadura sp. 3N508 TaxID=3375153 RepID=UPI0037A75683
MRMCIMHPRLGDELRAHLDGRLPGVTVDVVHDERGDPPEFGRYDVLVANAFPPGLLARGARLRWLQLTSVGTDQLAAGRPRPGLIVTNAGGIPARAVAEFALMGMLALAKEAPALVRGHDARAWRLPGARLLAGGTLVQVGLGRVGGEIARRARAFDMRVVGVTRTGRESAAADLTVPPSALPDVARDADHLVVAVPGGAGTRGLVGAHVVAALPATACLINVARPEVVDTGAVVAALRGGRLRGALLDVHDHEPLPSDSPLWSTRGLWVTPHAAFCYPGEAADLADLIAGNLRRLRAGEPLHNLVTAPAPAPR